MKIIVRSKAPLRLGIGGGGSDVSPYSNQHGGAVLNATINLYAHTYLEIGEGEQLIFEARDLGITEIYEISSEVTVQKRLVLHYAVYKYIVERFNDGIHIPLRLTTFCDAPAGSGLGSSSALVVSMLEAFRELLSLPLGEYDIARLAYEIERIDCELAGGKQDQYAAAFGGFNFMEFGPGDAVIINPLRIRRHIVNELQASTVLFFSGASRESAAIIKDQVNHTSKAGDALDAMHEIRSSAYSLKESLLKGSIPELAEKLKKSWAAKKATSKSITNSEIQRIEEAVLKAGATSIKISGAGGGGFMMILVSPNLRHDVIESLKEFKGTVMNFEFTNEGAVSWRV